MAESDKPLWILPFGLILGVTTKEEIEKRATQQNDPKQKINAYYKIGNYLDLYLSEGGILNKIRMTERFPTKWKSLSFEELIGIEQFIEVIQNQGAINILKKDEYVFDFPGHQVQREVWIQKILFNSPNEKMLYTALLNTERYIKKHHTPKGVLWLDIEEAY